MKVYDAASIRNTALVGHTGSGKTQLASAVLSDAGMINRFGKVDEGTTVTDYDEEEIARKHTLSAGLAYAEWSKQKINLIDTPGIGNFLSEARAALHVADAALVVVDAVAGVMVQTEKVWEAARRRHSTWHSRSPDQLVPPTPMATACRTASTTARLYRIRDRRIPTAMA